MKESFICMKEFFICPQCGQKYDAPYCDAFRRRHISVATRVLFVIHSTDKT